MPTSAWVKTAVKGNSPISTIRNAMMHEALFMGEPLRLRHGWGTEQLPSDIKERLRAVTA